MKYIKRSAALLLAVYVLVCRVFSGLYTGIHAASQETRENIDKKIKTVKYENKMSGLAELLKEYVSNILAVWKFDEGSGKTLKDSSSHKLNGVIYGANWIHNGLTGSCLSFNTPKDRVEIEKGYESLSGMDQFTISCWFKIKETQSSDQDIVVKKADNDGGDTFSISTTQISLVSLKDVYSINVLKFGSTKYFNASVGNSIAHWSNKCTMYEYIGSSLKEDVWYNLALTYDKEKLRLYVNGELENTRNFSKDVPNTYSLPLKLPLKIGRCGWENTQLVMDEVKINGVALTADEIKNEYDELKPDTYSLPLFFN